MGPAKTSLRAELGDELAALEHLDEDQQGQLLKLIQDSRARQHADIREAMEGALKFVPALLRAPIRALFWHRK